MTGTGQIGIAGVDVVAAVDLEADEKPGLLARTPRPVVQAGEVLVVDVDLDVTPLDVGMADVALGTVVDVDAEAPVEVDRRVIVRGEPRCRAG